MRSSKRMKVRMGRSPQIKDQITKDKVSFKEKPISSPSLEVFVSKKEISEQKS